MLYFIAGVSELVGPGRAGREAVARRGLVQADSSSSSSTGSMTKTGLPTTVPSTLEMVYKPTRMRGPHLARICVQ
ncbi:hypothetical protein J6590_012199 [Homalodisca vitripennis]|nr:hypothetical protein J6590_012199 [Homalodisca vitripennis]